MPGLDEAVMDFVADFTAVKRHRLTASSTLFGHLGVDGADGRDLIESFGQKFEVDLSEFRAELHFGPEGLPIYAPFAWLWCIVTWPFRKSQTPEQRAQLRAIRVADLIASAHRKKWTLITEPDGPANGSQPIGSETNAASSAAGSRR